MNVSDYLLEGKPESSPALLTLSAEHTYGELRDTVQSVGNYLVSSGGKSGDRVLLLAESGLFWVAAYLGILRVGMVCVPLPTNIAASDLEYILAATTPQFIFADPRATKLIPESQRFIPVISRIPTHPDYKNIGAVPVAENDLAALMFTSGSTGRPRGVMITHRNIVANTESIIEYQ